MSAVWRSFLSLVTLHSLLVGQSYTAPAGIRQAQRHATASILPGGRVIAPLGEQHTTGAGPFGLAVGPAARVVVTANGGMGRNSFTIFDRAPGGRYTSQQIAASSKERVDDFGGSDWRGVFMGLALVNDHTVWASEGNSGRVSQFDWGADRRRVVDLNQEIGRAHV